jgi:TonB-linked SusC/RagA family outer membrane protein
MYKIFTEFNCGSIRRRIHKPLLVMKLTLILLTATFLQVSAASYAQKVTLKVNGATIKEVFEKIQAQTNYDFLYNAQDLKGAHIVSLKLKDVPLKQALDICFNDQPLTYTITNTSILITKKPVVVNHQILGKEITGTVTDTTGAPVPGATVQEKNTKNVVITDVNGRYTILVTNDNAVLVFSFVGYGTREVPVSTGAIINVKLQGNNTALNEVVVVGYGTQNRSTINGAINTVGAKDIGDKPVLNTFQALQGESPNLIIQQSTLDPGSNVTVNIRGIGTTGNNDPLVVIDGITTQSSTSLNTLNPDDIASVTILKDAGSAAIYGSRAANGVILVTTKSGKFNQKQTVNYDGSYGLQVPDVLVHKVSAADNAYYKNEALQNSGLPPAYTPEQIQQLAAQGNGDWDIQHLLYNAPQQSQDVSVTGGNETSSYYISGGYQDQQSNFIGNGGSGAKFGYQKYNFRMNETTVIGILKLNAILNYTKTRNKTNTVGDNNIIADANRVPINYNWTNAAGQYLTNPVASQYNEYGVLEQGGYNQADNDQIFGNLNGQLTIAKDLHLTGVFGGTIENDGNFFRRTQVNYVPSGVYGNDLTTSDNNSKANSFNTQLYADYGKRIGDNNFKATVGVSSEYYTQSGFALSESLTDPLLGTSTTGTIIDPVNSYTGVAVNANSLLSAFGRLNYDYKSRYFLDFVFRDDASSKFAAGHRSGFFPSVTGGWLLSDETFMQAVKSTVNNLKLRASYGILGNQNVGNYQYQTTYFNYPSAYGFGNTTNPTSIVGGAGTTQSNPDLTWERAATFNIGVDFGLFNNKLTGSFDYFNKITSDILQVPTDIPTLYGATPADENVAKVRDRGWELNLTYTIRGEKVTQSFSGNIANSENTLLVLTGNQTQEIYNEDVFQLIRKVGQPITEYYGYKTNGFFQNQAQVNTYPKPAGAVVGVGDLKFKDLNNDGKIDDNDKTNLGDPFPHYTFGFTYRISYAGFDLSAFVQGVGERTEFLRGELVEPFHYNYGETMYTNQLDFWTPTNTNAKYPRLATIGSASNTNNWRTGSDINSFNAAYARLKNVDIGYTVPRSVATKLGMTKLRVSLIGQNLLTLTKLKFIDPETSEFGNNLDPTSASNSARAYLMPIFYGIGLNATF